MRVFDARLTQNCRVEQPGVIRISSTSHDCRSLLFFSNIPQLQNAVAFGTFALDFGQKHIACFVRLDSEKLRQSCKTLTAQTQAHH